MPKPEKLFVTEAECAERIGITTADFKAAAVVWSRSGLPPKEAEFHGRRYWPAVREWLDRQYGFKAGDGTPPGIDGEENWPV